MNPTTINYELDVYKALFESAAEGLVVADFSGTIRMVNPRIQELFGYAPKEVIGQSIEFLLPERIRERHVGMRDSFHQNPSRRSMGRGRDLNARRKDGTEFPVEVSLNHFRVNGDRLVMALITDITLRKEAEEKLANLNQDLEVRVRARTRELHDSQRLFNLIARNFPSGSINVFDRNLNYIYVEGKELYKMGVTSEKLTGTSYLDHVDPELHEEIREHFETVFQGKDAVFEIAHKGHQYEMSAVGLPNEEGEIEQILVVEHNISRQKEAQEEVRRALETERELNELKSRFVSMASHEFRTPLSTILTSASLVSRYELPEQAERRQKHLQRIQNSVRNLTSILDDFLSLDKLETGKIHCYPEPFQLKEHIEDIVEEMEVILKEGQTLVVDYDGANDVVLDPRLVRNALINLISNAIKYSPEATQITIRVRNNGELVTMEVIDQGIGIPEEDQQHIFDRFFRATNAINIQGTGLGLNIVRKYLLLMNGDIRFESIPGQGTTFFIHLPAHIK